MALVIALDIAPLRIGYAMDGPGEKPVAGTWRPSERDKGCHGDWGYAAMKWLRALIGGVHKPGELAYLCYEAPMVRAGGSSWSGQTNANTVKLQLGLTVACEIVAAERGLICHAGHVNTIRKAFAGSGRAGKEGVQATCRALGWRFDDADQADALAVFFWAKATFDKTSRLAHRATPMLQGVG